MARRPNRAFIVGVGRGPCGNAVLRQGRGFWPTALASMVAKYVAGELSMLAFNRYWCARLPELRPTAGYPTDARRFDREVGPLRPRSASTSGATGATLATPRTNHEIVHRTACLGRRGGRSPVLRRQPASAHAGRPRPLSRGGGGTSAQPRRAWWPAVRSCAAGKRPRSSSRAWAAAFR